MATVQSQGFAMHRDEDRTVTELIAGGSAAEAVVGFAGIILAIIGLAGIEPLYMVSIATICVGAALAFEGGALAAQHGHMVAESMTGAHWNNRSLSTGMSAEFMGGVATIVLGILSLIGIAPAVLCAVAAIVVGGALVLGSSATHYMNSFGAFSLPHGMMRELAREAVNCAAGAQVLCGIAAVVLGIIALAGTETRVLTLVALLIVSCSVAISGGAVSARMGRLFSRFTTHHTPTGV